MVDENICVLCGSLDSKVVYDGIIRKGQPGQETDKKHKVVECSECKVVRLDELVCDLEYYMSDVYREEYNDDITADGYLNVHDIEQSPRINRIGLDQFRGKVVLDYGCGGGAFLDAIKGVAAKTIGVEPFSGFHASLKERGHTIYSTAGDAIKELEGKIDVVVSFGVIEHTENPLKYLEEGKKLLATDGDFFMETDNLNDVLMHMGMPEFERFFYRTAHQWYFSADTLENLGVKAGLKIVHTGFRQNFDLSNAMLWMRDKKATGCGKLNIFDEQLKSAWISSIEAAGMADLIYMVFRK